MTKLLFRRWYFSLPMLLVSLVVVFIASQTVKPDYSAKGHVQLIPPVGTTNNLGEQNPIKNPWFDLGYMALGNAAMIDVGSKSVLESLAEDGLTDNVTISMDRVPLFEVEAVGDSPEQATATVQRVIFLLSQAVEQRQNALKVPKSDTITTLALDDGSDVEVKTSKILRVLIVAGGVGLLLTAAVTIGLDAILRRRASRQEAQADLLATGGGRPSGGPGGAGNRRISPSLRSANPVPMPVLTIPNGHDAGWGSASPARSGPAGDQGFATGQSGPQAELDSVWFGSAGLTETAITPLNQPARAGADEAERVDQTLDVADRPLPSDATIILPLSNTKRGRDGRSGSR
ncbi:MAG TPA: hypothetical protein VF163_05115 [Micromonosporaceae bacterium]